MSNAEHSATSRSEAFVQSVDLVLRVHQLMSAGQGESAEANRLRAASERPWYEMSDEEQDLVEGLSADLYSIGIDREDRPTVDVDNIGDFTEAIRRKDWSAALRFIREHDKALLPAHAALSRAYFWSELGQPQVAIVFLKEALRIGANWPPAEASLIDALREAG